MTFTATQGGTNPAAQNASVTNTGTGSLDVSVSDDASWLAVTPATATAPATLSVAPNISGLSAGTYTATVDRDRDHAGCHRLAQDDRGHAQRRAADLVRPGRRLGLRRDVREHGGGCLGQREHGHDRQRDARRRPASSAARSASTARTTCVTVPDSASLDLTTGMTLEAWVRPDARSDGVANRDPQGAARGLIYALYAGNSSDRPTDVFIGDDIGPERHDAARR